MKKFFAMTCTALLLAGLSAGTASAKHRMHKTHMQPSGISSGTTTGAAPMRGMRGNNAELGGNSGNSARGSNSLTNPNNPGSTGSGL